jgi:uncharacterized protein
VQRRHFIAALALAPATATLRPSPLGAVLTRQGFTPGPGPYGPIDGREPDENGLLLPEGFTSRVVAVVGQRVGDSELELRAALDGAATFEGPDGGWIHARNHELLNGEGGVTAIAFDADGEILDAYSILDGTTRNCAGGASPWGTWLSCEEVEDGRVWECDPTGQREAVAIDAMGRFNHEAVAFDPERGHWYLTEDQPDGRLYRYTPTDPEGPDGLDGGVLEAAVVAGDGLVSWEPVPDPAGPQGSQGPTRTQVGASMPFLGGEGIWHDATADRMLFTTKLDNKVWALDLAESSLEVVYDAAQLTDPPLTGVDNIVVAASGEAFVAEDLGTMDVVLLSPEGELTPFLRMTDPTDLGEVTGPCFTPDGTRMLVASYGYNNPGRIFEISGPFRTPADTGVAPPSTTTTLERAAEGSGGTTDDAPASDADGDDGDDGSALPLVIGGGAVVVAGGIGALLAVRRRGAR